MSSIFKLNALLELLKNLTNWPGRWPELQDRAMKEINALKDQPFFDYNEQIFQPKDEPELPLNTPNPKRR